MKYEHIATIIFILVIVGLGWIGSYGCNRLNCYYLSDGTGRETRYHFWRGCFIKTDDGFIPEANWRPLDLKKVE